MSSIIAVIMSIAIGISTNVAMPESQRTTTHNYGDNVYYIEERTEWPLGDTVINEWTEHR